MDGDLSQVLSRIEGVARPLVGLRTQSTEDWWPHPMVVVYMEIDTSTEGRNGKVRTPLWLLVACHSRVAYCLPLRAAAKQ